MKRTAFAVEVTPSLLSSGTVSPLVFHSLSRRPPATAPAPAPATAVRCPLKLPGDGRTPRFLPRGRQYATSPPTVRQFTTSPSPATAVSGLGKTPFTKLVARSTTSKEKTTSTGTVIVLAGNFRSRNSAKFLSGNCDWLEELRLWLSSVESSVGTAKEIVSYLEIGNKNPCVEFSSRPFTDVSYHDSEGKTAAFWLRFLSSTANAVLF
ncbi:hypothetical protein L1049_023782 [Liquidambar formosana]|uniref:Uncharacterized protein n=1 Tax=Liquidambar formosana TaxID=63359 RepID=A0AAP0X0T9_LIQFO